MIFTIYSLIMAIVWFDIFVLLGSLLQRKLCLFLNYNLYPITLLIVLSLIRLFAPVETPLTIIIRSEVIVPAIQRALKTEVALNSSVVVPVAGMVIAVASVVSIVLLARFFRACWNEIKTVRSFVETEDRRLLGLMDEIVQETKPGQSYKICVFNQNFSPLIWGLWAPVIIFPKSVLSLTDQEIHYILMHEWQHYLEKDLWIKTFIEVMCCIMWWNPVVYLLKKDMDQTFELKCDLKTTSRLSEKDRLDYLSTLLSVARMQRQPSYSIGQKQPAAIHFTGSAAKSKETDFNVLQRFQTVLKHSRRNRKIEVVCITCLLLLFLTSFRFVVQPYFAPQLGIFEGVADPHKDLIGIVTVTPENAYILERENGTYWFCINDGDTRELSQEELNNKTHATLPIIKEKKE